MTPPHSEVFRKFSEFGPGRSPLVIIKKLAKKGWLFHTTLPEGPCTSSRGYCVLLFLMTTTNKFSLSLHSLQGLPSHIKPLPPCLVSPNFPKKGWLAWGGVGQEARTALITGDFSNTDHHPSYAARLSPLCQNKLFKLVGFGQELYVMMCYVNPSKLIQERDHL